MGNNEYDFRIYQPDLVRVLEVYRQMEYTLETGRERLSSDIADTEKDWTGPAADAVRTEMTYFLESGDYAEAYRKVREMRIFIEESLPEINFLLARCEGFTDELGSDEYVAPVRPADGDNTKRNGGMLSLNYDMVPRIADACAHVVEENNALTGKLAGIMNDCSGLIEGTGQYIEALMSASRKINRLGNYAESFRIYADGIKALENDMIIRLKAIAGSTETAGRRIQEKGGKQIKGKGPGEIRITTVSLYDIDARYLNGSEEENLKKVRGLLKKEQWDEEEEACICLMIDRYCSAGDTEKLQQLLDILLEEDYEMRETVNGNALYYVTKVDDKKLGALAETSARYGLDNAYNFATAIESAGLDGTPAGEKGKGSYELHAGNDEAGKISLMLSIRTDTCEEWRLIEAENDYGISLMTKDEIIQEYERTGEYNAFERAVSGEKKYLYDYKQKLSFYYNSIKMAEAAQVIEELGLKDCLKYEYDILMDDDPRKWQEWNTEREKFEQELKELEEQGIDTRWFEACYEQEKISAMTADAEKEAREHPVAASVDSVFNMTLGAIPAAGYQMGSWAVGKTVNPQSKYYNGIRIATTERQTVSEGFDDNEMLKTVYNVGMGAVDFTAAQALTLGHGEVLLGTEIYAAAGLNAIDRGMSPDEAQLEGMVNAGITLAMAGAGRGVLSADAGLASTVGTTAAMFYAGGESAQMTDDVTGGSRSIRNLEYKEMLARGFGKEEADEIQTKKELGEDIGNIVTGGAIGALGYGTGKAVSRLKEVTSLKPEKLQPETENVIIGENGGSKGGSDANLLDDMGKFTDDALENNYQAYVNRKISKGQTPKDRLEWKKASDYWTKESPVARGNNFNKTVREADIYDYHEVYLENGKRLDSYNPDAGEIISRKATDLDKITEETYRGYLSEFSQKYSEGTKIRSNAYPELDGQELKGQYILEIPASNADISNIDYYKQIAAEYDVILRFTEEVQ